MKNLIEGNNNNNNNNNNCTAFMLAKMSGKNINLTKEWFVKHLKSVRAKITGRDYLAAENYPRLLKHFSMYHFYNDSFQTLLNKEVILLIIKMESHSKLIKESIGKIKTDYNDQRSAIRALIDCVLHSYGFDITEFNWRHALAVYQDYKNAA